MITHNIITEASKYIRFNQFNDEQHVIHTYTTHTQRIKGKYPHKHHSKNSRMQREITQTSRKLLQRPYYLIKLQ